MNLLTRMAVMFACAALLSCAPPEPRAQLPAQQPADNTPRILPLDPEWQRVGGNSRVQPVTFADGTRCVMYKDSNGAGGIACNWDKTVPQ